MDVAREKNTQIAVPILSVDFSRLGEQVKDASRVSVLTGRKKLFISQRYLN
jgi:hypothetical protein